MPLHLDPELVADVSRRATALAVVGGRLRDDATAAAPVARWFGTVADGAGPDCVRLAARLAESAATVPALLDGWAAGLRMTAERARRSELDVLAGWERLL